MQKKLSIWLFIKVKILGSIWKFRMVQGLSNKVKSLEHGFAVTVDQQCQQLGQKLDMKKRDEQKLLAYLCLSHNYLHIYI